MYTFVHFAFFNLKHILELTPYGNRGTILHSSFRATECSILWMYHGLISPMLLDIWVVFQSFVVTDMLLYFEGTDSPVYLSQYLALVYVMYHVKKLSINSYSEYLQISFCQSFSGIDT